MGGGLQAINYRSPIVNPTRANKPVQVLTVSSPFSTSTLNDGSARPWRGVWWFRWNYFVM